MDSSDGEEPVTVDGAQLSKGKGASAAASKGEGTASAAKNQEFKWTDLDESSRYAVATLCTCELSKLYKSGRNQKWMTAYVKDLIKKIGLSNQVASSILLLADEADIDVSVYMEMLQREARYAENLSTLLHDLLLVNLANGSYDARCRQLLAALARRMSLESSALLDVEEMALSILQNLHEGGSEEAKAERAAAAKKRKRKKYVLIGIGAAVGATVIGVTGGLAAPLVAAGAGVLLGGGSAALLGSTVGVALITTLFTTAGAGLAGYKMKKRIGDVKEFEFCNVGEKSPSLRTVVAVTGWLKGDKLEKDVEGFVKPWRCLDEGDEVFGIRWESEELHDLGCAISSFISTTAVTVAVTEALKHTVMATLLSAITWPANIVSVAGVIDNPWQICVNRAVDAGRLLADALLSSKEGRRPVTLVGYSMGGRLIFSALQELAKSKESAGIVEDVYILGAPVSANPAQYLPLLDDVVCGKLVIGYSSSDWVLKFLHRTATASVSVAGVSPVELDHPRLENVDLSSIVSGHNDYNTKLPDILAAVGLKVHPQSESGDEDDTTATAGSVVTEEEDGFTVVSQLDDAGEGKDLRHPECPVPLVELSSGHHIPQLGFGTYCGSQTPPEVGDSVRLALLNGFRHFDCAPIYDTQDALGHVFGDLSSVHPELKRSDLFITSKLWNTLHDPAHVLQACKNCIESLQCEYLDLFLIHSPTAMPFTGYDLAKESRLPEDENGDTILDTSTQHIDTWRAMEDLVDRGLVRSIGVSNFTVRHLDALLPRCRIRPVVNQLEVHPYCCQTKLVTWCQQSGIHVTAFSPLGSQTVALNLLDDSTVREIGQSIGKSPAQVCLRWATQKGVSVIPNSPSQGFQEENLGIFSFSLTDEQLEKVTSLNQDKRTLSKSWLTWDDDTETG